MNFKLSSLVRFLDRLVIPPRPIKASREVQVAALFGHGPFGGPM